MTYDLKMPSARRNQDPPAPDTLEAVLADTWEQLSAAAETGHHGFHLPILCSASATENSEHPHPAPPIESPQARVVVLRAVEPGQRAVLAHTDRRSPKVDALNQNPIATWVFYDPPRRIQVRLTGHTEVLTTGELVDRRWRDSNPSSRRCYLAPQPPGTPCDQASPNLPPAVRDRVPTLAETESGRANFAVIRTVARHLDVLYLHHAGHRRAAFSWNPPESNGQGHTASPPTHADHQTWLEV